MIEENTIQKDPPNEGLRRLAKWIDDTYYSGKRYDDVLNKISTQPEYYEKAIGLIHNNLYSDKYNNVDDFRVAFETKYGLKKKELPQYVQSPEKPTLLSQNFLQEGIKLDQRQPESGLQSEQGISSESGKDSSFEGLKERLDLSSKVGNQVIDDYADSRSTELQDAYDKQIDYEISQFRNKKDKELKSSGIKPGTKEWIDAVNKYEKEIYDFSVSRSEELSKAYNEILQFDVRKKADDIQNTFGKFNQRNINRYTPELKGIKQPEPFGFYNSFGRSMINFFINAAPKVIYQEAAKNMPKNYDELRAKLNSKNPQIEVKHGLLSLNQIRNTPIEELLKRLMDLGEPAQDSYRILKRAYDTGERNPDVIYGFYKDEMNRLIDNTVSKYKEFQKRESELLSGVKHEFTDIKSWDDFKSWLGGSLGQGIASSLAFAVAPGVVFKMEKYSSLDEIRDEKAAIKSKELGKDITPDELVKLQSDEENNADEQLANIIGSISMALEGVGFAFTAGKAIKNAVLKEVRQKAKDEIKKFGIKEALKEIGEGGVAEFSTEYMQDLDQQIGAMVGKGMSLDDALLNLDHKRAFNSGMQGLAPGLAFGGISSLQKSSIKEKEYAVPKRSTEKVSMEVPSRDSKKVVEGVPKSEKLTVPQKPKESYDEIRSKGFVEKDGVKYERQKQITKKSEGKTTNVVFTPKVSEQGVWTVIEADELQPSHVKGNQNMNHFIPEAQPKKRSEVFSKAGMKGAMNIAKDLKPDQITESPNAFFGAPTTNTRGEVIQGNSRADALKQYWESPEDRAGYAQYLKDNADKFGLKAEDISGFKKPVLVRMVKSSDPRSIELGQYDVKDLETGGKQRIDPVATINKLSNDDVNQLNEIIARSEGETLSEMVRGNVDKIIEFLYKKGAINETQLETVYNRNTGQINARGVEDLSQVFRNIMFRGADPNIGQIFESLPDATQKGIDKALPFILRQHKGKDISENVNNAIIGYNDFLNSEAKSMRDWASQSDIFNDGLSPNQIYTPFELALMDLFNTKKQSEIAGKIKEVSHKMEDIPGDMFNPEGTKGLSKNEAIEEVFGVKEKPYKNEKAGIDITGDPTNTDTKKPTQLTIVEVNPNTIAIVGDTFAIKDKIKDLATKNNVRAIWHSKNKHWMLPKSVENQVRLLIEQENGKNPQAQFANQHVDGRTINQRQSASKILMPRAMQKLINFLSKKVNGIRPVVFDYNKLVDAWEEYKRNGGIIQLQSQEIPVVSYSLSAFRQQQNNQSIPNGFIYKDQVYINPRTARMDTPIHEFGHIWVNVLKHSKDKALYHIGVDLVKGTSYEADVRNNPAYAGLSDAEVYDEALAIAIGEKGAALWDRPAWKRWWDNFVSYIKQVLGLKQEIDFNTLTMAEWSNIAAKELMSPGQIISMSSIHSPETAIFTLKNYKMPKDAFKAYRTRLESDAAISLAPDQWNAMRRDGERFYGENLLAYWFRTKPVLKQISGIKEIILDSIADRQRILKLIQNNIVDQYYTVAVKIVQDNPNLTPKQKKAKIASISKESLRERLISDNKDIYGLMEVLPGKQHRAIQAVREKLFGINPMEDEAGAIIEWLTKNTSLTGKVKLTEGTLAYNLAKEGLTFLDFGMYAYASMAKARNAKHRADSNGEIQAGSGMPDSVADDFLAYFNNTGKTQVLEDTFKKIREMQEQMLKMELEAGLITKELHDYLLQYDNGRWMPLYVTEYHKDANNLYNNSHIKGVWSNGIKKAKGSDEHTFDQRTNPFVGWLTNYEERLKRLEHHKVLNALAELVEDTTKPIENGGKKIPNPNKKFWRIEKTKVKPGPQEIDDNGNLKPLQFQDLTDKEAKKTGIPYIDKKTGKLAYIVLRDQRLIRLFTTAQRNQGGQLFIQSMSGVMNFLRIMRLNLSADWGATNFMRDLQDAILNLGDRDVGNRIKDIRRKIVKVIPEVIGEVWKFESGKRDISDKLIAEVNSDTKLTPEQKAKKIAEIQDEYKIIKIIEEQRANGGYISSINYNDANRVFKQVDKMVKDYETNRKSNLLKGLTTYAPRQFFRQIFIYGKVMENALRTATYMTLRESGVSELKSAKAALNVTVNLSKNGYLSPYLSAAFLFFNASVQGPLRMVKTLYTSPSARKFIIGGMASGMVAHFMNQLFAGMGDDDDKEKRDAYYKSISMLEHKRNLYLYNPIPIVKKNVGIGDGSKAGINYYKIPISYNLQPFKSISDNLYFMLTGDVDMGEATTNILESFEAWGNPFYEHTEKGLLVPTITEPYAEIQSNRKFFFDSQIYPEDTFNPGKPDSEKYYKHTPKMYVETSRFLSEIEPNKTDDWLEVSPNSLEHVTHWLLGGFKSYIDTGSSVVDIAKGGQEGIDPNRFPLLRRLYVDLDRQQYRFIQRHKYLTDKYMSRKMTQKEFNDYASESAIYVMSGHIRLDYFMKGIKDIWLYQIDYFKNKLNIPFGDIQKVMQDDKAVMEYINSEYEKMIDKKIPKIKNRVEVLESN